MKLLVNGQRRWATIKCFAASGNRSRLWPLLKRKRAAAMPAALLLEGLSLICADPVCLVRVAGPPKTVRPSSAAPVTKSSRAKTAWGQENVPIFPGKFALRVSQRHPCERSRTIAAFSRNIRCGFRNENRHSGPLCRRMVSALSMHCPAKRRDPIRPAGPAASWSSRFGARAYKASAGGLVQLHQAHLDGDPDQVGMILCAEFLLSSDVVFATVL